jgi:hypothetical protein
LGTVTARVLDVIAADRRRWYALGHSEPHARERERRPGLVECHPDRRRHRHGDVHECRRQPDQPTRHRGVHGHHRHARLRHQCGDTTIVGAFGTPSPRRRRSP